MQLKVDLQEAHDVGCIAVWESLRRADEEGVFSGTVGIVREKAKKYDVSYVGLPITDAAKYTRSVPKEYIAKNGHDVTQAFIDYAKPIVGELPVCEIF